MWGETITSRPQAGGDVTFYLLGVQVLMDGIVILRAVGGHGPGILTQTLPVLIQGWRQLRPLRSVGRYDLHDGDDLVQLIHQEAQQVTTAKGQVLHPPQTSVQVAPGIGPMVMTLL